jgi:hypothetical protein
LKTNNCRFFASLRMTGLGDFFTRSCRRHRRRPRPAPEGAGYVCRGRSNPR